MRSLLPDRSQLRPILLALAVLGALYAMYFAGLGTNPLLDPDEPIYGVFVKDMVARGDWLTPHYAGRIWFDKPPLFYWLSAICVKVIGLGELAIRMPSAVCGALIVLLVYLLTSYDFGKRAGALAAAVVGTTLLQIIMSHAAATDAVMVGLMTAALYAYRRWLDSEGRARLGWITLSGAAAGLGMLAKGPLVPLLLVVTFILHLAWTRQLARIRLADVVLGAGAALVIGLPWYLAMYNLHGKLFVDQFIVTNNLTRFAQPLHKGQTGQWYSYFRNIPLLLVFFLPWSVFLPQAIARNWTSTNVGAKLAFCWVGVVLVFFSLSKTQNFAYTYPAFPACALMLGTFFADVAGKRCRNRAMSIGIWVGLAVTLMMAVAVIVMAGSKFPQAAQAALPTAIVLALLFAVPIAWTLVRRSSYAPVPWMIATGMIAFNLASIYVLMPAASDYMSSRSVAHRISNLNGVEVVAFRLWRPGLVFYLDRKPVEVFEPGDAGRLAGGKSPVLFVCNERDEKMLELHSVSEIYGCGNLDVYANEAYLDAARTR
jgi:4-amino-4-deoxy-L-arabinose transferase-like glycosyltransferase